MRKWVCGMGKMGKERYMGKESYMGKGRGSGKSCSMGRRFGKRAFLFTIMTLLLLSSLFSLAGHYLAKSKATQDIKIDIFADKITYVISDISKSYFDILGINLSSIERNTNMATVKFSQLYSVPNNEDYSTRLLDYELFLEGIYKNLMNINLTIDGLTSNFEIMPFQTSFSAGNDFYAYTVNSSAINSIFILILLNESGDFIVGTPIEDIGTNPNVHVIVILSNKTVALDSAKALRADEPNEPFYVQILDKRIDIYFGMIDSQPGTLKVAPALLGAEIRQFEIGYSTTGKVYITVGSVIIDSGLHNTEKKSTIIIAEG